MIVELAPAKTDMAWVKPDMAVVMVELSLADQ